MTVAVTVSHLQQILTDINTAWRADREAAGNWRRLCDLLSERGWSPDRIMPDLVALHCPREMYPGAGDSLAVIIHEPGSAQ